ncbi:unnamed protein product [Rhizoctonia solani]|uniref:Uncharacterized protein n=1 Tax=Rhizoctonia solani TaxID=456999 RepID=A0A8H3ADH7_9AGAM|nr:unnamed protein product [Rhizoctonia solani]
MMAESIRLQIAIMLSNQRPPGYESTAQDITCPPSYAESVGPLDSPAGFIDHTDSEQHPLQGVKYIPNIPSTPVMGHCETKTVNTLSLYTGNISITASFKALDGVLHDLHTCVKGIIWPSELDFPMNTDNVLILPDTKKNKPFIKRLRKLNGLWWRLDAIPTHNNEQLKAKHGATDIVIRGYIRMMNDHILDLHAKFVETVKAAGAALDNVYSVLTSCIKKFKYPSELDFPANAESPLLFIDNGKSQLFIDQLCTLDKLRTMLARIRTHGNEQLENKHRTISVAIGQEFQRMKDHQLKLWEKFEEAKQSINAAKVALDVIYGSLDNYVKKFRYPSELDFPANATSPMIFISNEKSKPFIDQLFELNNLRTILAAIPTHGDKQLKKRHEHVNAAVGEALRRMGEHQLKLYVKHTKSYQPQLTGWV